MTADSNRRPADDCSAGTLGHALFAPFVLVFDYGGNRVAFVPKD